MIHHFLYVNLFNLLDFTESSSELVDMFLNVGIMWSCMLEEAKELEKINDLEWMTTTQQHADTKYQTWVPMLKSERHTQGISRSQ